MNMNEILQIVVTIGVIIIGVINIILSYIMLGFMSQIYTITELVLDMNDIIYKSHNTKDYYTQFQLYDEQRRVISKDE